MKLKRIICTCLSLAMLVSALPVFAVSADRVPRENKLRSSAELLLQEKEISAEANIISQVEEDLQLLEKTMLRDLVQIEDISSEEVIYSIFYEDINVKDIIHVNRQEDGTIVVTIEEGNKKDIFLYKSDGTVLLNGKIMPGCNLSQLNNEDSSVQPMAGMIFSAQAAPISYFNQNPSGITDLVAASGYEYMYVSSTISNISLSSTVGSMTVSAILNVLASYVANGLLGLLSSPGGIAVSTIVSLALSYAKTYATAVFLKSSGSTAISYKIVRYAHESNNTISAKYIYAIDSYANSYWYGDNFVWGILETGYTT